MFWGCFDVCGALGSGFIYYSLLYWSLHWLTAMYGSLTDDFCLVFYLLDDFQCFLRLSDSWFMHFATEKALVWFLLRDRKLITPMVIRIEATRLWLLLFEKFDGSFGLVWSADVLPRGLLRLIDTFIIIKSIFMLLFSHENGVILILIVVVF